jgi:hypothetical protein
MMLVCSLHSIHLIFRAFEVIGDANPGDSQDAVHRIDIALNI